MAIVDNTQLVKVEDTQFMKIEPKSSPLLSPSPFPRSLYKLSEDEELGLINGHASRDSLNIINSRRLKQPDLQRDDRLVVHALYRFRHTIPQIATGLPATERQVKFALKHPLTPRKKNRNRYMLKTP